MQEGQLRKGGSAAPPATPVQLPTAEEQKTFEKVDKSADKVQAVQDYSSGWGGLTAAAATSARHHLAEEDPEDEEEFE